MTPFPTLAAEVDNKKRKWRDSEENSNSNETNFICTDCLICLRDLQDILESHEQDNSAPFNLRTLINRFTLTFPLPPFEFS